MSEAKDTGKKKKGKLPVIVAAILVLAGGGYFATSGKKKEPVKEPDLVLGEKMDLGEFTTPLSGSNLFLQVQVVIQLADKAHLGPAPAGGASHSGGGKAEPDPLARNAVLTVLRSTTKDEIATPEGIEVLKEKIAWQINHDAEVAEEYAAPVEGAPPHRKKKKKGGEEHFEHVPTKEREYPDLDDDYGPVHVVMFTKFLPIDYGN